mgnify:CR=1 FL=1
MNIFVLKFFCDEGECVVPIILLDDVTKGVVEEVEDISLIVSTVLELSVLICHLGSH